MELIHINRLGFFLFGILVSYLLGSIPTAYILGRILKGIDIRKSGSGNIGATNAFRVLGKPAGIAVLILDITKGLIPVVLIGDYIITKDIFVSNEVYRLILGLSAVIGHNWTIFLNFKGGKGVATTGGVIVGLAMKLSGFQFVLFASIVLWLISLYLSKMVSFASVTTAAAFPLLMLFFNQPKNLIITCLIFSIFIILRHKSNIRRILQGKEPRVTFFKTPTS